MAEVLDSYAETNQDVESNSQVNTKHQGQNTVSQTTYNQAKVTSVKFYLKKTGSPTGNIVAKIYTQDGSGLPVTQVGGNSDAVAASSVGTSYGLVEFTWSSNHPILDSGTNYGVYYDVSGCTLDGSNYIGLGCDGSSPSHGGALIYYDGANWNAYGAYDACFYLYGEQYMTGGSFLYNFV